MSEYIWILIAIAPLAFMHGWFVGRHFGVKIGAAGMFDQLRQRNSRSRETRNSNNRDMFRR